MALEGTARQDCLRHPDRAQPPWCVLLIEDNQDQAELIRRGFERDSHGVRLLIARSLRQAGNVLAEARPDLVITDVRLPDGSGMELLSADRKPAVPVIVMTSFGDERMAVEAIKAGALDYVAKSPEAFADMPRIAASAIREWRSLVEKEAAQNALREAQQRERIIHESIPVGLLTTDLETGRIVGANRAAAAMLHTSADALVGAPLATVLTPETGGVPQAAGAGEDAWLQTADGAPTPVLRTTTTISLHRKAHRVDSLLDMTERRRQAEQMARLAAAVAQTADAVMVMDADGRIDYVNPAFQSITGHCPDDVLGTPFETFCMGAVSLPAPSAAAERDGAERSSRTQISSVRKDGTVYHAEVVVSPVRSEDGRLVNYVSVLRDITRERSLEVQLRQSQKLEAVGQLAGGVAHDFNNMLQVILGHVSLIMEQQGLSPQLGESLGEIRKAGRHAADLTRQLLTFARRQAADPRTMDLNEAVSGTLNMLRRLIGEDIELVWRPGQDLWPVVLDPTQVDQVLTNLSVNARDAIAGVGRLTIETQNVVVDQVSHRDGAGAAPGEYVLLKVSDTGSGMDDATLQRAFEPFFTTKPHGKGTGLGLSTVFGIVGQNQGFIRVATKVGRGTAFHIYFPRAGFRPADARQEEQSPELAKGSETVLFAEDEGAVLAIGKSILERHGYTVLAAESPAMALALAKQHPGPIHLLVTDVVMPGMSGKALRDMLTELRPGLPTLFISGYAADMVAQRGVLQDGVDLLHKPFRPQQLADRVRAALDRRAPSRAGKREVGGTAT